MSAKIQVMTSYDVIEVTSQIFCYHCVEYITFDTYAKFHDHRSNKKKLCINENGIMKTRLATNIKHLLVFLAPNFIFIGQMEKDIGRGVSPVQYLSTADQYI